MMNCRGRRGFPLMWPCDNPCSAIPIPCVSGWLLLIKGGSYVVVWIGLLWYYFPGWHPVMLKDTSREVLIGWRAPGSSDWLCGVAFIVSFWYVQNSLKCWWPVLGVCGPRRIWLPSYGWGVHLLMLARYTGVVWLVLSVCFVWIGRVVWSCWCGCSHCCGKKG